MTVSRIKLLVTALFISIVSCVAVVWSASPPSTITYQGKLLVSGSPASTTLPMMFEIYTASSGGSLVYTASGTLGTPTTTNITPERGLFTVYLGDTGTEPLNPDIFKDYDTLYLQVTINGETLNPRKRIATAPYAFNSKYLDGNFATSTPTSTSYIPVADASGNFNFNDVTSTNIYVSGNTTASSVIANAITLGGVERNSWPTSTSYTAGAGLNLDPFTDTFSVSTSEDFVWTGEHTFSSTTFNSTTTFPNGVWGADGKVGIGTTSLPNVAFPGGAYIPRLSIQQQAAEVSGLDIRAASGTLAAVLGGMTNGAGILALYNNTSSLTSAATMFQAVGNSYLSSSTLFIGGSGGIGTDKLRVAGDLNITSNGLLKFNSSSGTIGQVLMVSSTGYQEWINTSSLGIVTMPAGISGQTLRHNGSDWVANDLLYNDGTFVGIGTTTPNTLLSVAGTSTFQNILPNETLTYTVGSSGYRFKEGWFENVYIGSSTWKMSQDNNGNLNILNNGTTNGLYISANGNAGIGSARASTKFFVDNPQAGIELINDASSTSFMAAADDIRVVGNFAYTVITSTFRIYDITDKTSPSLAYETTTFSNSNILEISEDGDTAFIFTNTTLGKALDISNLSNVVIATSVSVGNLRAMKIVGNNLYLAVRTPRYFTRIDISDPYNPTPLPFVTTSLTLNPFGSDNMDVSGNYAYVPEGSQLEIIDMTFWPSVVTTSILASNTLTGVDVVDNYAYIADSNAGLRIFDVTTPLSPSLVGSITSTYGRVQIVHVRDNYAYLGIVSSTATEGNGIEVMDISNPSAPVSMAFYQAGFGIRNIDVDSNRYIYVDAATKNTIILRFNPPASPYVAVFNGGNVGIGTTTPGSALTVAGNVNITGQYLVNGLPLSSLPSGLGGEILVNNGGTNWITSTDIYVDTGYGYVGIGTTTPGSALTVSGDINITGDYLVNGIPVGGLPSGMAGQLLVNNGGTDWVTSSAIYVNTTTGYIGIGTTAPTESLTVMGNISNLIGSNSGVREIATTSLSGSNPNGIYVSGNYAYVANFFSDSLSVVDISNPTAPIQIATTSVGSRPISVYVSGRYIYVVNKMGNSISVVDISNPKVPTQIATTSVGSNPTSIYVSGRYAYVANTDNSISVVDISNPYTVVQVATTSVGLNPSSIYVSGRYAYVTNYNDHSISVVDISNPTTPIQIATTSVGLRPFSIYVSGRYAYVTNYDSNSVSIVDISNPNFPTQTSAVLVGSHPTSIYVSGRYAYVTNYYSDSVSIIDIANPNFPTQVYTISLGSPSTIYPNSIYVSGRYAYVVNALPHTISIIDISGTEVSSLIAHSAEAGNLQIRNDLMVKGRGDFDNLSVGTGGILSNGAISIMSTNTPSYFGGKVGIGTTSPQSLLHIEGGSFLVNGSIGTTPISGTGTRMMYVPSKAAFRAGATGYYTGSPYGDDGSVWNDANIGFGSTAFGANNLVTGVGGFSAGANNRVTGQIATAFGALNLVSGTSSLAVGTMNTSSGDNSFAFGASNIASGNYSTVFGMNNTASGYNSFAGGALSSASAPYTFAYGVLASANATNSIALGGQMAVNAENSFGLNVNGLSPATITNSNTIAFMGGKVGVGTTSPDYKMNIFSNTASENLFKIASSSNQGIFVVNSNGNIGINTTTPDYKLNIFGTSGQNLLKISTSTNQSIFVINSDGRLGIGTSTPVAKLSIDGDGSILAKGDGTGWDGGGLDSGYRLMWIPRKYAFRAGYINGTQWNSSTIGNASAAFGNSTLAKGTASFAAGDSNSAIGNYSAVFGNGNIATGTYAFSAGVSNIAFGQASIALGYSNNTWGNYSSVAGGLGNSASGTYSFVGGGYSNSASGTASVAMGYNMTVNGNYSFGFNASTTAATISQSNVISFMGGKVGIGTTSPAESLSVKGSISNVIENTSGAKVISRTSFGSTSDFPNSVIVSGRYAYVGNSNNYGLSVVDISNPADPKLVTSTLLGGLMNEEAMVLVGNYIYVAQVTLPGSLIAIDVSDPKEPKEAGRLVSNELGGLYITGKYAYTINMQFAHKLMIVDISNPTLLRLVTSTTIPGDSRLLGGWGKYLSLLDYSGKYVSFFDISSPENPTFVASTSLGSDFQPSSIAVSGRYAYITSDRPSAGSLAVVDISNPRLPQIISTTTITNTDFPGYSISISGRYAYIVDRGSSGSNSLVIFDITSSTNPTKVTTVPIGDHTADIFISGRYGYAVYGDNDFAVVDITGAEVSSLMAHSAEAGNLQVRNDLTVKGVAEVDYLSVGFRGLISNGSITIMATNTTNYFGGAVGIGTSSPSAKLSIVGTAGNSPVFEIASSTGSSIFRINHDGKVGIGTTTPSYALTVAGDINTTGSLRFNGTAGTAGQILMSNGSSAPSWANTSTLFGNTLFMQGGNSFGAAATLGTLDNYSLTFKTNNTDRMFIGSTGNIGIGTTTPSALLTVFGDSSGDLFKVGTSTNQEILSVTALGTVKFLSALLTVDQYSSTTARIAGGAIGANVLIEAGLGQDDFFFPLDPTGPSWNGGDLILNPGGTFDWNPGNNLNIRNGNVYISSSSYSNNGGRVVIGTGNVLPAQRFSLEGGIYSYASFGQSKDTMEDSFLVANASQFIWHPKSASLRAGYFTNTSTLAESNMGNYSIGLGYDVSASGDYSFAFGKNVTTSNDNAYAFGRNMDVSGIGSVGFNLGAFSESLSQPNTLAVMGGQVGIGTTTPSAELVVDGDTIITGVLAVNTTSLTGANFIVDGNAKIYGYFTVCPVPGICGMVSSTDGSWYTSSDLSLKKNITDFTGGLDKVLDMRPVGYEFNAEADASGTAHIGFIAQEMEQIIPQIVGTGENGLKSISYANLTPILVSAIKEQQTQIDALKNASTTLTVENSSNQIVYTVDMGMDIAGRPLLNVASIVGADNKWEIDINGTLISKVTTASGTEKKLYGMSSENIEITLSGTSTLENGEARVTFSSEVQELIDETQTIKANVTLTSLDTNNGIAVINKDKTGFTVKELNNGASSATFDWFVVAKRKIADPFVEEITSGDSSSTAETPTEADTSTIAEPEISEPIVENSTSSEPIAETPPSEPVVAPPLTEQSSGDGENPPVEQLDEEPPAEEPPVESIVETESAPETPIE